MQHAIETHRLKRSFWRAQAVRGVDLGVPEGSIYAFVGPNGAGKTTTIKVLMNILEPTAGEALVLGTQSTRLGPRHFEQIGYVSENQEIPGWMTVRQLIAYCKPFYPTWDEDLCQRLIQLLNLPLDRRLGTLSNGERRKAALLSSLAYRPRLLVMDEPFNGLDILAREELVQGLLEAAGQHEWTIVISSHDIEEVERLADWVGYLHEGKLHFSEPVASLQSRFRQVEITAADRIQLPSALPESWLQPEPANRVIRFVDAGFSEPQSLEQIQALIPGTTAVTANRMSLKSILLALTRTLQQNPNRKAAAL
jgi:ABC-2 type transport system ATP-binding protein